MANGRQQRLQTLLQRVFALSVTQPAALIMRLHLGDKGRIGMESIKVSKDNIAFDSAWIADPQMGRVGIHGADRTMNLLFTGRERERIAQRF